MTDTRTPTDIKEVVKEKYGQAALRVKSGGSSCCGATPASDSCCDPITSNLYDAFAGRANCRKKPCWLRWAAAIPPRWPSSIPEKWCSISVPAAASTCCSRRAASVPPARPTASI